MKLNRKSSSRAVRIVCVPGTWQLITAAAAFGSENEALADSYLNLTALYDSASNESLHRSLGLMAGRLFQDSDILDWNACLEQLGQNAEEKIRALRSELPSGIDAEDVGEIWLCKLNGPKEKLICEAFSNASIVLYEAGLENYLGHPLTCGFRAIRSSSGRGRLRVLRRELRHLKGKPACLSVPGWCGRYQKRVRAVHLALSRVLPLPVNYTDLKIEKISIESLRTVASTVAKLDVNHSPEGKFEDSAWLIGQGFSYVGVLSVEEEKTLLIRSIELLLEDCKRVVWVEHPRNTGGFGALLTERFGRERVIEFDAKGIPLECYLPRLNPVCVAGCTSSALFYLPLMFRIPSYTFQHWVKKWPNEVFRGLARMTAQAVRPIEQFSGEVSPTFGVMSGAKSAVEDAWR